MLPCTQGVTSLFQNHAREQFATHIPISGRIDDKKLGTFFVIVGVIHNAVVKAHRLRIESHKSASHAAGK